MNRQQRLAAWLEDKLDADNRLRLLDELSEDSLFARQAARQLQMQRLLKAQKVGEPFTRELVMKIKLADDLADDAGGFQAKHRDLLKRVRLQRRWHRGGLVAAMLAVAASIMLLLLFRSDALPQSHVQVVASEGVPSLNVRALQAGQVVRIERGILELALGNASHVVLEGPAEFSVESSEVIRLASGRCYAEMDRGTSGLRIKTPAGEMIDLGTRFGVEVFASNDVSLHVFEGEVELASKQERSVFREGEAVYLENRVGATVIATEAERFIRHLPSTDREVTRWLHWPFDERDGQTTQPRGRGFPDDLTPARVHGARWIEREGTGALRFDGIDDWVETSFAGIGADADRTVAAWVQLAPDFGVRHGQAIVGWGDFEIQNPTRRVGGLGNWASAIRPSQSICLGVPRSPSVVRWLSAIKICEMDNGITWPPFISARGRPTETESCCFTSTGNCNVAGSAGRPSN